VETKPTITIVHELAGRWRLRLSVPPEDPTRLIRSVQAHEGIGAIAYSPIVRSLLVHFDPQRVTREEIMMRIAVSLSEQKGLVPVYVLTEPARRQVSPEVWGSGALLLLSYGMRLAGSRGNAKSADWVGGLSVAAAVVEHARREHVERGTVDPEVWTLLYLVWALLRKNALRAAAITWLSVFGRHLLHYGQGVVEVRPVRSGPQDNDTYFQVALRAGIEGAEGLSFSGQLLESIVAVMGGQAARFIGDLRNVTRLHDQVLHGLGRFRSGVPVKFS
jgi:hypothetical protein